MRPKPDIRPFTEECLDGAGRLLAERHERHRSIEPLLPVVGDFRQQVERDMNAEDASGVAAFADGALVGYLIGKREEDQLGSYVRMDLAGHASREPELVRDLYAAAAESWVAAGLVRQFVFVPAIDDLITPWFQLGFGASAVLAARPAAAERQPLGEVSIRAGTPADLQSAATFGRLLYTHLQQAPSFSGFKLEDLDWFVDDWRTTWDDPTFTHFIAERGGQPVGHLLLYRRPMGDLRVPEKSIDLANAATLPELRGTGVGLALTAHALAWAYANGYRTVITDWRITNLVASRFWPARGFRPTFMRLYRSIP